MKLSLNQHMRLTIEEVANSPVYAALYLYFLGRLLGHAALSIARDRVAGREVVS